MALPTPQNPVGDINAKVQALRAKYQYDKGAAIDRVISQARSDGLPDADLNILLVDNKNLQEAKSQGHLGGIAKTLHTALNIASPVMGQVMDAPQRGMQIIDAAKQNIQGAGQQIKTGAQNIAQSVTSPDTYVNENGVSVPSQGGRDVMNRVSQAGMGVMDIASGAGQAALTPYVAPMGAVKDELGAAAKGYSEAWKALPEKVKIVLKNVPVSPTMPGLSWGDAINQINNLPNDIKEVVMEGITTISGAASVGTTVQGAKDAFNAADKALAPDKFQVTFEDKMGKMRNYGTYDNMDDAMNQKYLIENNTSFKADIQPIKGEGPLSNAVDKVKGAVKSMIGDKSGFIRPFEKLSAKEIYSRKNLENYLRDSLGYDDQAVADMNTTEMKNIISDSHGGLKDFEYFTQPGNKMPSLLKDTRGEAVMPTGWSKIEDYDKKLAKFAKENGLDLSDPGDANYTTKQLDKELSKSIPSGELQLPKRLQSLQTGDYVTTKGGELAKVTGSSSKGLEVKFLSDGSKDTITNFDSVSKSTASEVSSKMAKLNNKNMMSGNPQEAGENAIAYENKMENRKMPSLKSQKP